MIESRCCSVAKAFQLEVGAIIVLPFPDQFPHAPVISDLNRPLFLLVDDSIHQGLRKREISGRIHLHSLPSPLGEIISRHTCPTSSCSKNTCTRRRSDTLQVGRAPSSGKTLELNGITKSKYHERINRRWEIE